MTPWPNLVPSPPLTGWEKVKEVARISRETCDEFRKAVEADSENAKRRVREESIHDLQTEFTSPHGGDKA